MGGLGGFTVVYNRGDGTLRAPITQDAGGVPRAVALGDVDGDGKQDLVVANTHPPEVDVIINQGGGVFAPATRHPARAPVNALAVGDLNGDGKLDVAAASASTASASVLLNQGNGRFAAPISYPAGPNPIAIELVDLNSDGKPDLVAVSNNDQGSVVDLAQPWRRDLRRPRGLPFGRPADGGGKGGLQRRLPGGPGRGQRKRPRQGGDQRAAEPGRWPLRARAGISSSMRPPACSPPATSMAIRSPSSWSASRATPTGSAC